jgi:hypothetical protein
MPQVETRRSARSERPALAVIGTTAWLIGSLSAGAAVRRAGDSWLPVVFLMISALGLFLFRTHAWPGGPLSFGALALAAAGIAREDRHAFASGPSEDRP